jgi:hypothetical protein
LVVRWLIKRFGSEKYAERDSAQRKLAELGWAAAYASAGKNVPLCTGPIEKLIPQIWPKATAYRVNLLARDHVEAAHFRQEMLAGLADAQVRLGDLRAAAETRLRAMLASLFDCKGDWNSHGPAIRAEEFWQVVRHPAGGESSHPQQRKGLDFSPPGTCSRCVGSSIRKRNKAS